MKTRLKKLYNGPYIQVSEQILAWRKRGGQDLIMTERKLERARIRRRKASLRAANRLIKLDPLGLRDKEPEPDYAIYRGYLDAGFMPDKDK